MLTDKSSAVAHLRSSHFTLRHSLHQPFPALPPPIFDSQCTRHWRIMQDYSLLQLTERSLTLWKVFSVTSDHHCLVWRWLYFIFSISIISLSVKQFSCTWLAVIIVSFEISLMCYVCSPFLTRKHLCWIQSYEDHKLHKRKIASMSYCHSYGHRC